MISTFREFCGARSLGYLGALGLCAGALASACTSNDSPVAAQTAGTGGALLASGGAATAGSSSSSAGSLASAGALVNGGTGGGGAGSGGSAGSLACAEGDECCSDPNKTEPGECGCGTADLDSDDDGELDCKEQCLFDPNKTEPGECGCGLLDNDSDDDGEVDCGQGHYFEAEAGVLSEVDAPVVPVTGEGGAGGAGGASGEAVGGAGSLAFTIGSDAKASQEEFLEAPAGVVADALPGPARATYEVEIPADDQYVFWGRFYTPDRDHNRVWVRIDNGTWTKLRVTTGETWFWYTFHQEGKFETPISYELTEGMHTLTVASATDGVKIDRFYVTPASDKPKGDDTLCNPPHTVDSGGVCLNSCGGLMGDSCDAAMCAGKTLLPAYDCDVCCKL